MDTLKILLIQPKWAGLFYHRKVMLNEQKIHPIPLGIVAALSGEHHVRIIDEAIENIPSDLSDYDLAGISVNTYTSVRAYQIAKMVKQQGKPVVFGGAHTALMPDECLEHADSIVIGDAEDTWPVLLTDFCNGTLKPRYVSQGNFSSKSMPIPRRDLFKRMRRKAVYCQVSRGCDNRCKFCYLQSLPCKEMRMRDIDDVYHELKSLKEKIIIFVDDNLFCDRDYAIELFRRITPLKKKWLIQAPTNIYDDEELVSVMAESGGFSLTIGFQTPSNLNNENEKMYQNDVNNYKKLVDLLHKYKIFINGTFIFGFDGDTKNIFKETGELIKYLQVDAYIFYFLVPYPGTQYYEQYARAGRILTTDWSRYDWDHVVIEPKNMTAKELKEGVEQLYAALDKKYLMMNTLKSILTNYKKASSWQLLSFLISSCWHYKSSRINRERI